MITLGARPRPDVAAAQQPGAVRLLLDVQTPLDERTARFLRSELERAATVDVVLLFPRRSSSTDPTVVARLARERQQRVEELARVAGGRAAQVTVFEQRRWRRSSGRTQTGFGR